jgi:ketosteroid isomerase-like protein
VTRSSFAQGDRVVVLSQCTWRYKRTGKVCLDAQGRRMALADGKAVEYFEYYDTAQVHAAVA